MPDETTYFVRVGALGHVGRFGVAEAIDLPRGARVVCRSRRGLEIGEVLSRGSLHATHPTENPLDGTVLRPVAPADELVLLRLGKNREAAFEACQALLRATGNPVTLVDVEQLFDGQTLFFYFLGGPPTEPNELTQSLAETFESHVKFAEFTQAVEIGCGPQCGTEEAPGCGSSCGSCALAGACSTTRSPSV